MRRRFSLRIVGPCLVLLSNLLTVSVAQTGGSFIDAGLMQQFSARYGREAMERLQRWKELLNDGRALSEHEKLLIVNKFFNQVPWLSDTEHWGQRDYWATPLEVLGTHGADCEDYAVAKYISLVNLGIDESRLRIIYVRAPALQETHMVLAYYASPKADPLILDNLITEVKPGSQRSDLIPVYSFNAAGVWAGGAINDSRRIGAASKVEGWRAVTQRMLREGIGVVKP